MTAPAGNCNGRNLTLAALAEAKHLPAEFLRELGLHDLSRGGVGIPYYGPAGEKIAVKQRTALKAKDGSYWPAGTPLAAYGQWRLDRAREKGFLILVEGESDCWVLWHRGLPGLGLPGANTAKALLQEHVEAVGTLYVHREPDQGGAAFVEGVRERLAVLGFPGKAFELRLPDRAGGWVKDPAELHARDPARFLERLHSAITASAPLPVRAPLRTQGGAAGTGPGQAPAFDGAPLPIRPNLLPVPRLDPGMIPAPFRGWLVDIAARGCFPLEYPTAAALVTLAALVGRKVGIRPKRHDDWLVVPNLWGAIVGPPGVQKTPPVEEAMRPLRRLVADALRAHEGALRAFAVDASVAKARAVAAKEELEKAARDRKNSDADLRELARKADPPEDKPPLLKRYETNDPTVEKLGEVLAENPNGVLLFRDELMGFLRSLDKQGHESDRAFYLESWSGTGSFTYDRIGRGTLHIPSLCVSVFGTIQPGPLARYVRAAAAGDNDGLLNRFQILFYPGPPQEWVNVDRYPDTHEKNTAYAVFRALDALDPAAVGAQAEGDSSIPCLRFSPEAQALFDEWRTGLENRLRSGDDPAVLQCHLAKYRSLLPSLALLFRLIDVAGGQEVGPVTLRDAEAAAAWCDLLEAHAQRLYQTAFDGDIEPAVRLARRLRDSLPNPFKARDLQRKCWSGLDSAEDVERALLLLEERGWVKAVEAPAGGEGGRPTRLYWVNPAVLQDGEGAGQTPEPEVLSVLSVPRAKGR
jgi:putative DNA primase/helicase